MSIPQTQQQDEKHTYTQRPSKEEVLKDYKVRSLPLAILFPVLTRTHHYCRSTYTAPPIRRNWPTVPTSTWVSQVLLSSSPSPPTSSIPLFTGVIHQMSSMTSPLESLRILQKARLLYMHHKGISPFCLPCLDSRAARPLPSSLPHLQLVRGTST
jgi:hypothetical protein